MKRPAQQFILGAGALFILGAAALYQAMTTSADVYAAGISPGSYAYCQEHTVGSPSFKFGYQKYCYSTDATGAVIWFFMGRKSQPGETQHWDTTIFVGSKSFSAPMEPPAVAVCAGLTLAGLLALGRVFILFGVRRQWIWAEGEAERPEHPRSGL